MECIPKSSFSLFQGGVPPFGGEGVLGEPTLEVRAEDKTVYTMPYEEEEDRVCEVKCPKGGGGCSREGKLLYYCLHFWG